MSIAFVPTDINRRMHPFPEKPETGTEYGLVPALGRMFAWIGDQISGDSFLDDGADPFVAILDDWVRTQRPGGSVQLFKLCA